MNNKVKSKRTGFRLMTTFATSMSSMEVAKEFQESVRRIVNGITGMDDNIVDREICFVMSLSAFMM